MFRPVARKGIDQLSSRVMALVAMHG